MKKIDHKGERIELSNTNITLLEHIHRYIFASNYIKDKIVLDAACGTGYGSNYLSNYAKMVYGIDINADVIDNNKEIYKKENLIFTNGSVYQLPYDDNMFDVIVSFETIEHVDNGEKVFSEFNRVLKDNGLLIISTPNKNISIQNNINNPFHVHEYFEEEFIEFLNKYFNNVNIYYQSNLFLNIISNSINKDNYMFPSDFDIFSTNLFDLQNNNINKDNFIFQKEYFISVAHNNYKDNINNKISIYEGKDFLNNEFNNIFLQTQNNIYKSINYKIGFIITYPFKFLLNLFKIKRYPDL